MKNYAMIIDKNTKKVIDIVPFSVLDKHGHYHGTKALYVNILPDTLGGFGWVDCRTTQSAKFSKKWLRDKGYT